MVSFSSMQFKRFDTETIVNLKKSICRYFTLKLKTDETEQTSFDKN